MKPPSASLPPRSRRPALAATLLALFSALILFAGRAAQQTADSLDYALSARTGREIFHPHHLLFTPMIRLTRLLVSSLGGDADPLLAGQLHNIAASVIVLIACHEVVRRWTGSSLGGVAAALLLLACRGFWLYSTLVEVYLPATACLALLVVLVAQEERRLSTGRVLAGGLLLALAVLYHQPSVLFCVPLGYWFFVAERGRGWKEGVWMLGIAGLLTATAYLLAFLGPAALRGGGEGLADGAPTPARFVRFCLAYAFHPVAGWGTARNLSVLGVGRLLHSQLRNVTTFPWSLRALFIPGTGIFLLLLGGWHLRAIRAARPLRRQRIFLLVWIASYYLFFLWWFPGEKEFFVTPLLPLVLLISLAAMDRRERSGESSRSRLRLLIPLSLVPALLLGAVNLRGTILPYHRSRGPAYREASELARAGVPEDCWLFADYTVAENLRYYFGREKAREGVMPLYHFYEGRSLPQELAGAAEGCLAIDLEYVNPDFSAGEVNGALKPRQWFSYLKWLLGAESGGSGGGIAIRRFKTLGLSEGKRYLLLTASREIVASWPGVFGRLDTGLSGLPEAKGPFARWLERFPNPEVPTPNPPGV
jgi:4-amino-4-deoxy-L-arabinose transferase-like glycosyltransferase